MIKEWLSELKRGQRHFTDAGRGDMQLLPLKSLSVVQQRMFCIYNKIKWPGTQMTTTGGNKYLH